MVGGRIGDGPLACKAVPGKDDESAGLARYRVIRKVVEMVENIRNCGGLGSDNERISEI